MLVESLEGEMGRCADLKGDLGRQLQAKMALEQRSAENSDAACRDLDALALMTSTLERCLH